MGQNYLRSLIALGFQAFLIIVCVAIYAVLVQSIATESDIIMAMANLLVMREMRPLRPKVNYRVTKKTGQMITRGPMKQCIPSLRAQKFCLAVLRWSEKQEV